MSHSSAVVSYRPEGAGQKPRRAAFDLALIPDPETWLTARLGPLAAFVTAPVAEPTAPESVPEAPVADCPVPLGLSLTARRAAQDDAARGPATVASLLIPPTNLSEQETHP